MQKMGKNRRKKGGEGRNGSRTEVGVVGVIVFDSRGSSSRGGGGGRRLLGAMCKWRMATGRWRITDKAARVLVSRHRPVGVQREVR